MTFIVIFYTSSLISLWVSDGQVLKAFIVSLMSTIASVILVRMESVLMESTAILATAISLVLLAHSVRQISTNVGKKILAKTTQHALICMAVLPVTAEKGTLVCL